MADGDRTVVPSASRLARAWRGGLRSRSRWLDTAAVVLAVSVTFGVLPMLGTGAARSTWSAALVDGTRWPDAAGECATLGLWVVAIFAATTMSARVVVAVLTGTLGAVDSDAARAVGSAGMRPPVLGLSMLSVVAVVLIASGAEALVGAAARGVDASALGSAELWSAWVSRAALMSSMVLGLVGLAELLLVRRARFRSLFQTVEDARREARRR